MKTLFASAFAVALAGAFASLSPAGAARAQPAPTLLPAQSELVFTSRQMGVAVEGRFRSFEAQVALDPKQPEAGRIEFAVDTSSATLGLADTDAELRKPAWFDTAKFPRATFQSTQLKRLGAGRFEVAGTLAIKGSVQEVVVPVLLTQSGATSVASGSFALKRLAFRIGEAEWADTSLVADEVQVRFRFAFSGVGPL